METMEKVLEYFGCMVFDDIVMKSCLSDSVYKSLRKSIDEGTPLDISVANTVELFVILGKGAFDDFTSIAPNVNSRSSFIHPLNVVSGIPFSKAYLAIVSL